MLCLSGFELYSRWVPLTPLRPSNNHLNIRIIFFSKQAFEFCCSSFANKHKTLPESTSRNINRTNLHFKPQVYQINYVNIDLCHQYGTYVTETETFLLAKLPERRGTRRNSCFRGLACPVCLSVYLPISISLTTTKDYHSRSGARAV